MSSPSVFAPWIRPLHHGRIVSRLPFKGELVVLHAPTRLFPPSPLASISSGLTITSPSYSSHTASALATEHELKPHNPPHLFFITETPAPIPRGGGKHIWTVVVARVTLSRANDPQSLRKDLAIPLPPPPEFPPLETPPGFGKKLEIEYVPRRYVWVVCEEVALNMGDIGQFRPFSPPIQIAAPELERFVEYLRRVAPVEEEAAGSLASESRQLLLNGFHVAEDAWKDLLDYSDEDPTLERERDPQLRVEEWLRGLLDDEMQEASPVADYSDAEF